MDSQKKQTPNKSQLMYDPMIIPRVKQYLEENVHQRYLDVGVMARMLQERYREYSRRKSAPFRQLVEQAYRTVLHSYGLDSNPSSDAEEDPGSDLEVMEDKPDPMNSMLTNMYMNNKSGAPKTPGVDGAGGTASADAVQQLAPAPQDSNELIDISSDDDDDVEDTGKHSDATGSDKRSDVTGRHANTIISVVPAAASSAAATTPTSVADTDADSSASKMPAAKKRKIHATDQPLAGLTATTANAVAEHLQAMLHANNLTCPTDSMSLSGKHVANLAAKLNVLRQQQQPPSNSQRRPLLPTPGQSAVNGSTSAAAAVKSASSSLAASSARRAQKRTFAVTESSLLFHDVGGMDHILKELCELLLHIKHPEVYRHIGLPAPRGFLLHGPPGCGKTLLAQAIAGQMDVSLIQVAATELVAGVSGESEERIRELFEQAAAVAPCVLFIDEIDAISSNRQNAQKDMERRIVSQLLASLDGLAKHPLGDQVLIIGATNRADTLDPALRRVGRFDQEISLGIPDRRSREDILRVICSDLRLKQPFDYDWIAALTPGYVGADLLALATRAASIAVKRAFGTKVDMELRYMRAEPVPMQTVSLLGADDEVIVEQTAAAVAAVNDDIVMETVELDATKKTDEAAEKNAAKESEAPVATEPVSADTAAAKPINGAVAAVAADLLQTDDVESMETDDVPAAVVVEALAAIEEIDADVVKPTKPDDDKAVTDNATNEVVDEATTNETTVDTSSAATPLADSGEPKTPDTTKTAMETVETAPETATAATAAAPVAAAAGAPVADAAAAPVAAAAAAAPPVAAAAAAPVAAAVIVDDDEIVDLSDDETFDEALQRDPNAKMSLTLDEMVGWLNTNEPILSGDEMQLLRITMADFCAAVKVVQPSAKREGFITVPDVTWADIGALRDIREELQLAVLAPVRYPKKLEALGLKSPSGVLLCGPPGCGKTLLAKAVANEAGINFISVKGPELLNMYVGESERAVRQCFQRARNSAPCVIFFDEFDALCPTRSGSSENTSSSRVVNQLLTEMDGVEERKGVFLMAATNRPDIVDPAVLRPGRLDKILYVGLPGESERAEILEALTKHKPKLARDVSYTELAAMTENFTGADLAGLVRQASLQALKDSIVTALATPEKAGDTTADAATDEPIRVRRAHFVRALTQMRPSVSEEDKRHYLRLQKKYTVMPATPKPADV